MDDKMFNRESIYTSRAGLVLAAPFFPKLFDRLGYLINGIFVEDSTQSRAVHILEFIVTGYENVEEHALVLQKLLSGLPIQKPVDPLDELTEQEIEISESMLNALLSNWPGLEHTTIDALRETFLQREGRLQEEDGQWTLSVEIKSVDVLIDRIPWSIGVIKLPWMKNVLKVEWR
ncbi:contractile injection system tape measure protein [Rhodohalobacter sulfatireducens]|uniref:Uncharacterized protein n=1 Tax=Rhodohalobacter sulfatireducens TaxID=2911366 RepID=A0ABS9KIA4_9BACT|nr:contractile injection system tape measure protein [Rhodohalobacter sulfatireducens]MCG2590566.1 hypothetical protein [Rhodohalobacter sulfatireducens]